MDIFTGSSPNPTYREGGLGEDKTKIKTRFSAPVYFMKNNHMNKVRCSAKSTGFNTKTLSIQMYHSASEFNLNFIIKCYNFV